MSKELQDQAAAEKLRADNATAEAERAKAEARAANERLQQLAQAQATERHAAHVQFAEKAMSEGRLKKPEVPLAVAALDFIGNLESAQVQFSEGGETKNASVLAFVKERIAAGAPLVNFSEQLPGGAGGGGSRGAGGAHGLSDEELDKQAREFSAKHSVSYADALTKVVSFTN